jgi:transcriptional regulator with XRE-family HTH domain
MSKKYSRVTVAIGRSRLQPMVRIDDVTAQVASRVRTLRAARGWSLDELGRRSGVSKGMLVQIEGDRTNPSIATLVKLGNAFGVGMQDLLAEAPDPTIIRIEPDQRVAMWSTDAGSAATLVGGVSRPAAVELWDFVLAPGDRHASDSHIAGGREILAVTEGRVTITVANVETTVAAGEAVIIASDNPHSYANDGDVVAVLTMVTVEPAGTA